MERYAIVCFLVSQTLRRTTHIRKLATVLTIYGAGVAMFALLQSLSSSGKLYWIRTPRFGGWIYGPYVNHNQYAGLMEMLAPIPLVFTFSGYARGRKAGWQLPRQPSWDPRFFSPALGAAWQLLRFRWPSSFGCFCAIVLRSRSRY